MVSSVTGSSKVVHPSVTRREDQQLGGRVQQAVSPVIYPHKSTIASMYPPAEISRSLRKPDFLDLDLEKQKQILTAMATYKISTVHELQKRVGSVHDVSIKLDTLRKLFYPVFFESHKKDYNGKVLHQVIKEGLDKAIETCPLLASKTKRHHRPEAVHSSMPPNKIARIAVEREQAIIPEPSIDKSSRLNSELGDDFSVECVQLVSQMPISIVRDSNGYNPLIEPSPSIAAASFSYDTLFDPQEPDF